MRRDRIPWWASRRTTQHYTAALDDSGQRVVRASSRRHAFLFGGVVVPSKHLELLRSQWNKFLGKRDELKKVSFSKEFDSGGTAPHLPEAVLSVLLKEWDALPWFMAFDKSETGAELTVPTRKGERRINLSEGLPILIGALAAFLGHVRGTADVVVDHMASPSDDAALQAAWGEQWASLSASNRARVPGRLSFVDSRLFPEVQVADVLMGLFRASQEEDRGIVPGLVERIRVAEKRRLFGFHLS